MEKFLTILTENAKVREDFLDQNTPEGAYRVAKPYLEDMTMDEFVEQLLGLVHALDTLQGTQLTEEDLNEVSGGFNLNIQHLVGSLGQSINYQPKVELMIENIKNKWSKHS